MFETMINFVKQHRALFWGLGIVSLVLLILSAVIVPLLVVRMPADYFRRRQQPAPHRLPPLWHFVLTVLRNVLGVVLIIFGLIMLVLPGQGILTILLGLVLMDFPAKERWIRFIMRHPLVLRSMNWIRRRAGKLPLAPPEQEPS